MVVFKVTYSFALFCSLLRISFSEVFHHDYRYHDGHEKAGISTVVEWKRLRYLYDDEEILQDDLRTGVYDPDVPAPIDVDVYRKSPQSSVTFFVTTPKFQSGVPASLSTVSTKKVDGEYALQPFPTWNWHRNASLCRKDRLVSVFRTKIDPCGRLWIVDSGSDGDTVICPPQLLVFDLNTDWQRPIYRHTFDSSLYESASLLLTIQLDQGYSCTNTFAYIADCIGNALIVVDTARDLSWKLRHSSMLPSPDFTAINIASGTIELSDGILGIAVAPPFIGARHRIPAKLIYSPMSGNILSKIDTHLLKRSRGLSQDRVDRIVQSYRTGRKSQSAAMDTTRNGVAIFGLMSNITINCWNTASDDYGPYIHTIYSNPITMQFASGLKIKQMRGMPEEVWIMTARFQNYGAYNFSEVNFRISRGNLDHLLQGSDCERPNVPRRR